MPKRDLYTVLTVVRLFIPATDEWQNLSKRLEDCQNSVLFAAPEVMCEWWLRASEHLAELGTINQDSEVWKRAIKSTWLDKPFE